MATSGGGNREIKASSEQRRRRKDKDRGRGNRREERDGGERERKEKGKREGEIKGKIGRPRRVDIIDRERSMSVCGTKSMEEYIKRKRESEEAKEEGEEEGEFKGLHQLENFFSGKFFLLAKKVQKHPKNDIQ